MYESEFCEYAVTKKAEGGYLFKICAVIALSVVVALALFFVALPKLGFSFGAVLFAALIGALWYLSRYTQIEYEYSVSGGYMDFASVYSKQYRKEILSVDIKKSARKIAPYKGDFDGINVSRVYDMRSSASVKNAYYLVFEEENDKKAVLFDATAKCVNALFHQAPSVVTRTDGLPE